MKKIHINFRLIIVLVCFIVGAILCIKGAKVNSEYEKAISFAELEQGDIKEGTYVCGYIDSYVIREETVNGIFVRSGVSQTLINFTSEDNDIYTIPVLPDAYIQLMAREDVTKNKMEALLKYPQDKVYFEGKIVKYNIEPNYPWYGAVDSDKYPNINNIITGYYVREIKEDELWIHIKIGSILLLIAVLTFVDGGGFRGLVEETEIKIDYDKLKSLQQIEDKEYEIINRESILRQLTRRQKRIKNKRNSSIVMILLGVLVMIIVPMLIFVGIVLAIFGAKGLWDWFINSSNIYAIRIAKKFRIESIYLLIQQCKMEMKELEELIYDEDKEI